MLIFFAFKRQRHALDILVGMTVQDIKRKLQERLGISVDFYRRDNKVLVLSYAGAELGDTWVFSDLGILPGTTVKVQLKENVKPVMYIRCSHNLETINVFDDITITNMTIDKVRSLASRKSGLPVGIFRLITTDGREMFDSYCLQDYNVDVGHTILLETWDGWDEFLNLAIMGFTQQAMSQVSGEEVVARYQMKVALFIASHLGHVDLARCILKQGIRSDEPTGYHPARMWCKANGHIDSLKCPVHEATLCGQVGVLRLFVNHDITCLKARDGNGLEPLNIALRQKVKNCASFLLSKQWTKVNISKTFALHVATYTRLKKWCDRAKERALLKYGPEKSSLKRRNFNSGPLISHGVVVDGFSKSPMTGKSKTELVKAEKDLRDKEIRMQKFSVSAAELLGSTVDPENYFRTILAAQRSKLRQRPGKYPLRWHKSSISPKFLKLEGLTNARGFIKTSLKAKSQFEGSTSVSSKLRTSSIMTDDSDILDDEMARLASIVQSKRLRRRSQSLSSLGVSENRAAINNILRVKLGMNLQDITERTKYNNSSLTPSLVNQSSLTQRKLNLTSGAAVTPSIRQPLSSERSERTKRRFNVSISTMSDRSGLKLKHLAAPSETSTSSNIDDVFLGDDKPRTFQKQRGNSTNTFLSLKGTSSKGSIPLPIISHVQDRRPFFYHHGLREDQLVESTLDVVAKYKGNSSRERAITSLTLANSFSEKPWLCRVRFALNLTSNSLKRSVRKFEEQKTSLV